MSAHASMQRSHLRHDGFGSRYSARDLHFGAVEILELSSALGTPAAEQAIRATAARQEANASMLCRVIRIARKEQTLSITSVAAEGIGFSDVLAALEFGTVTLGDEAILELAGAAIGAVARMHQLPGSPAHGALNPSHLIVRRDASVALTGTVFGDALQALQCNREQLWRIFGVALPPSASLPRFDQRTDVTQLGTLVLALLLRRTLTPGEYPKGMIDLVEVATEGISVSPRCRSALRMWLQQTLQLHPKALFASASDAARAYADVVADVRGRRAASQLHRAIRQLSGDPVAPEMPAAAPRPVTARPPEPPPVAARSFPFLRSVFPVLRAN
jgi:hypothetical protein